MGYNQYGSDETDIAYRANYNPFKAILTVNMHELCRFHGNGRAAEIFEYIYANPNRTITASEIINVLKLEPPKGLDEKEMGTATIVCKTLCSN